VIETAASAPPTATIDPAYEATLTALRFPPSTSKQNAWLVFFITLALFAWLSGGFDNPAVLAILIAVILIHELGHFVAMKLFGYTDVRMFFIPLFGAAVTGRPQGVAAWKRGVVLLAGPVPGLLFAFVAIQVGLPAGRMVLANLVSVMLVVNFFNLLPLVPLDGGKLFELVAFGRKGQGELAVAVCSAVGLTIAAFALGSIALGIVVYIVLRSIPIRLRVARLAAAYATAVPAPSARIEDANDSDLQVLYRLCAPLHPGRPAWVAGSMRAVHDRAAAASPSLGVALGLLGGYALAVVLGLIVIIPMWSLAHASNELDSEVMIGALTLRHPHSFKVARHENALQLDRGFEAVLVTINDRDRNASAENVLGSQGLNVMMMLPPEPGHPAVHGRGQCAGLDGPETSWLSRVNGMEVAVRACAALHDGETYVLTTIERPGAEKRVATCIAAGAHF
jgi:Zn-dependent protease